MPGRKDPYKVLGVSPSASQDDIRRAYRDLARRTHPDVSDEPDAQERFSELQAANEILSDPEKRKLYDQYGTADPRVAGANPFAGWTGGAGEARGGDPDLSSLFEQFFGGGFAGAGPGAGPGPRRAQPVRERGSDIAHTMRVTFVTAAQGGTETLKMTRDGKSETIDVRIPAGIETGARLRVRGRGRSGSGGSGDIILSVEVGEHPWYERDVLDLYIDIPITIAEAALGATVDVPLIGGGSVSVKVPPGTASGRKLRVKKHGIRDESGREGDLYVVLQIEPPAVMTPRARELVEELAAELKNPRDSAPWVDH